MGAERTPLLFENYSYGMPRGDVLSIAKAGPCEPPHPLALCASSPVEFLNLKWQTSFWFNNEDRLQQIMLTRDYSAKESFSALEKELKSAGWLPVYFESDDGALDLVEQSHIQTGAESGKLAEEFVSNALKNGGVTVSFLPSQFVLQALQNASIATWSQAVDNGPEDLRMLSLRIDRVRLAASFTAPLLSRKNALRYGQMIKR